MKHLELEDLVDHDELRDAIADDDLVPPPESLTWAVTSLMDVDAPEGSSADGPLPLIEAEISVTEEPRPSPHGGFRYATPGHRDIRVRASGVHLELSVDPPNASHDLVVLGRLEADEHAVGDVPVHLRRDGRLIVSTMTNELGDLHIELPTGTGVELVLVLRDRGQVRVPIY